MSTDFSRFWVKFKIRRRNEEDSTFGSTVFDTDLFKSEYDNEAATAVGNYFHYKGNGAAFGDQSAIEKMNAAAKILQSKGVDVAELELGKKNAQIRDL